MFFFLAAMWVQAGVPADETDEVDFRVSGDADVRFVHRPAALQRAAETLRVLGAGAASSGDADFVYDRARLRFDLTAPASFAFRVGLETPTLDEGSNVPLGRRTFVSPRGGPPLLIRQAYADYGDLTDDTFFARAGFQELRFQNRPPEIGEPFFLDLSESESAWAGLTYPGAPKAVPPHSTRAVRNVAARDRLDYAGARFHYAMNPFVAAEAFYMSTAGLQEPDREESLAGVHAGAAVFESASVFVVGLYQHGPFPGADIGTIGAGADGYLDDGRTVELFAEAYAQFGSLIDHKGVRVHKAGAYAWNAGFRKSFDDVWIEAAYAMVSGDQSPGDRRDNAFQSHENVDQFLILESDEFGLDIDTNYRAAKLAVGHGLGPGLVPEGGVFARLDAGAFDLNRRLAGPFGAAGPPSRDLGVEIDATVAWRATADLDLTLRAGVLVSSNVLRALAGESDSFLITVGPQFRF